MEAHLTKTTDDVVALRFEVLLQRFHFSEHFVRFKHGDCGFLEGNVRPAVQVGSAGADCFDEFLFK